MKKAGAIIIGITFFLNITFANQQISETEKLALTGKIWGFLKYYHPNVAQGKFNWDEQLLTILPKVKAANTKEELSKLYYEWIQGLGYIKECRNCKAVNKRETFNENFNLDWIKNVDLITSELSKKLIFIEQNRHQGKKYYVSANKYVGNVNLTNDLKYLNFDWRKEDLRLLTLFRYWNVVEYFFPYKYQTDTNWEEILNQSIPKFLSSKTEQEFHLAMLELIVSIDDSHGAFHTNLTGHYFGRYWMPVYLEIIEDSAVITEFYNEDLAAKDDLQIGDVITKVDGRSIKSIFEEKEKYIYGSNIGRKKYNSFNAIFNGTTNFVTIEYERANQIRTKKVSRYAYEDLNYLRKNSSDSYKILEDNIGYVNMGVLTPKEVPEIMESLKGTKAIIFDIRKYPNSTLYSIASYITSGKRDFYKVLYPDLNYPGKFLWRNGNTCGKKGELKYKGKVVLLANEKSQSHAEFTIMCLQTGDNVVTIGSQTSGADGNVSQVVMASGEKTMFSGIGIFYPDGTETQRIGIKIDVVIKPTIDGIRNRKDEVLDKAIEVVKK